MSEDRVTAESYGALNEDVTETVDNECWMIRIPPKLAELWAQAEEGTDLGELVFVKGNKAAPGKPAVKPSLTVTLSPEFMDNYNNTSNAPAALTTNYSLQAMTKKVPVLHPFSRNPRDGTVKIWGTVTRTANMQVEKDNDGYRAMLKDRLVNSTVTSNRYVKPTEATESVVQKSSSNNAVMSNKRGFGNAVLEYGKRMLEQSNASNSSNLLDNGSSSQGSNPKKQRLLFTPDQSLRSIIFELFSQKQYWTVKDLKAAAVAGGATHVATRKAESDMRELLREIGEYHRSGDYKTMWELRKEFQQATAKGNTQAEDGNDA